MDSNVRKKLEKININGELKKNELMSAHTTFKTGGPAEYYCLPSGTNDILNLLAFCRENGIPCFILGGGANILVADKGIEGIVIDMQNFNRIDFKDTVCYAGSGAPISTVAEAAGYRGLSGLEFIYAMPGSTGGAIWMNARCYGSSISEILQKVEYIDEDLTLRCLIKPEIEKTFAYKESYFQGTGKIILQGEFLLAPGKPEDIKFKMETHKKDREKKGHFLFPSAGSIFKNNRSFGQPTGVILDSLGLKGLKAGGAKVSDFHGNIIINTGTATSKDIRELIDICYNEAEKKLGMHLDCEVQFVGKWD